MCEGPEGWARQDKRMVRNPVMLDRGKTKILAMSPLIVVATKPLSLELIMLIESCINMDNRALKSDRRFLSCLTSMLLLIISLN